MAGFSVQHIFGFVEELVVADDPEFDTLRHRRGAALHESRQTVLHLLDASVRRRLAKTVLDMGGNAVLGYHQNFDGKCHVFHQCFPVFFRVSCTLTIPSFLLVISVLFKQWKVIQELWPVRMERVFYWSAHAHWQQAAVAFKCLHRHVGGPKALFQTPLPTPVYQGSLTMKVLRSPCCRLPFDV